MRLCIDLTEILSLDCTNPLVRVTAEQWLECYKKWPEHCVGSYGVAVRAAESYEPPPPVAPAPYSIDLSAILGLEASSSDTIVSLDQWKEIYKDHPDYCYGGPSKSVEERNARATRRAERNKLHNFREKKETVALVEEKPQEAAPLRPLSSYPLKVQDAFRSKIQDTLGPALLKFFCSVGAIPSNRKYHPLTYTRQLFSLEEIDAFFDKQEVLFPKIKIHECDISQLDDDFSGCYVSSQTIKEYFALAVNTGYSSNSWIIEGENLKIVEDCYSKKEKADLIEKISYIREREGIFSLLDDEDFVDDLLRNKPDLISLWEKCHTETLKNIPFSTTPDDLDKKSSAFARNLNTEKWEPAA